MHLPATVNSVFVQTYMAIKTNSDRKQAQYGDLEMVERKSFYHLQPRAGGLGTRACSLHKHEDSRSKADRSKCSLSVWLTDTKKKNFQPCFSHVAQRGSGRFSSSVVSKK